MGLGKKGGGGGVDYLKKPEGIFNTWQALIGIYIVVYFDKILTNGGTDLFYWDVVTLAFTLGSCAIIILKLSGIDKIPQGAVKIFYIAAAMGCMLSAILVTQIGNCGSIPPSYFPPCIKVPLQLPLFLSITQSVFYIYGAVVVGGK